MRYRVTFEAPKNVKVYDAQEGIYFGRDTAFEVYDLIYDELKSKTAHFSVKLEELADCAEVIVLSTLKYNKQ